MNQQPYWTKVAVSDRCVSSRSSPCEKDKGHKVQQLITDKICGRIRQKCNSRPKIIWKGIRVTTSGTIKVTNTSDCEMRLIIKKGTKCKTCIETVLPKDELTLTIGFVRSIAVKCCGPEEDQVCSGCFTLIVHYPFNPCEKEDCCCCCEWC
ncbi:S-Ena type endospore appendage [Anaeromicrobium sediminis]|uniref:Endospore appendages core domain-containing protein n=1 Tax=Anaeromicrobium sediminis TaxID=1478221 RepID=A0A267MLZ0_9FIRM|nr:S-Ena type endospore appendage [Anaeromicrobium sediminis]PAB60556.1 hypothetical protein CCE28_03155 [Anaeromicrobium sediminis]